MKIRVTDRNSLDSYLVDPDTIFGTAMNMDGRRLLACWVAEANEYRILLEHEEDIEKLKNSISLEKFEVPL